MITIKKIISKAFIGGYWSVAYRKKGDVEYIPLTNQKHFWNADPFILERDMKLYVFTELYDCKKDIGKISCSIIIPGNETYINTKIIIDSDTHQSFPFIYNHNDRTFLIIESSQSKKLPVYEITNDPYTPVYLKNIFNNAEYVDCCLLHCDDKILLFGYSDINKNSFYCFLNENFDVTSDLHFFNSSLKERPAGMFCSYGRPAQFNENKYGEYIVFYDYFINKNSYFEKINNKQLKISNISFINSNKIKAKKIHTYNSTLNYEVIDFFVEKIDLFRWFKMLKRKHHKRKAQIA